MQISPTKVTVLTPEGDFIKLNKERKDYQIGEEIMIDDTEAKPIFKKKNGWKVKVLVSALAATVLLIVSFLPSLLSNSKVSAYVSMDIKSSIELGITEDLKVVEVKGINEEGEQIIAKLKEWKGRDMDDVIREMVALNRSAGHLEPNSNILFSTVMIEKNDRKFEYSLQQKLKDTQDMSQIDNSVKIEMKKASVKDREEASDKGISTGTYLEQTKEKTKNPASTKTEKSDITQVIDNKDNDNHPNPIVEKVNHKQQSNNNSDSVQSSSNSQVSHEKKQTSVKASNVTDNGKKNYHVTQKTQDNAIKQGHKVNNPKKSSPPKENHTNKEVRRGNLQKEQEIRENKRNINQNRQEVDKQRNHNQKPDKSRKQEQEKKQDNRKQYHQRDREDKQRQHYQREQEKQKQPYQRGQDKRNQENQRDRQDARNQYQKRHGD